MMALVFVLCCVCAAVGPARQGLQLLCSAQTARTRPAHVRSTNESSHPYRKSAEAAEMRLTAAVASAHQYPLDEVARHTAIRDYLERLLFRKELQLHAQARAWVCAHLAGM